MLKTDIAAITDNTYRCREKTRKEAVVFAVNPVRIQAVVMLN